MIVQIQYCVDEIGDVIRIQFESQAYLMSICNSWSVFREVGTKFVPSETRLHIVYFSEGESRRYSTNGISERKS